MKTFRDNFDSPPTDGSTGLWGVAVTVIRQCTEWRQSEHRVLYYGSMWDHVHGHICHIIMDFKLCVILGKSASETFGMMRHVYGNDAMSRARCYE